MKPPPKQLGYFNDVMPPSLDSNHVYPSPQQESIEMAKTAKKKAAKKKVAKKATKRKGSAKAKVGKGVEVSHTAPLPVPSAPDEESET